MGENRKHKEIVIDDAYILSLVTGEKIPVAFGGEFARCKIQPRSHFRIDAMFPNEDGLENHTQGISLEKLRSRFSEFKFIFVIKGKKHQIKFGPMEVEEWLKDMATLDRPVLAKPKAVLPGDN